MPSPSPILRLAKAFALVKGMHRFLRHRLTVDEARTLVQERLAHREDSFLRMVESKIYGHPKSPYLPLLRSAGCHPGDIATLVRSKGLEACLQALRNAGVYFTFEEFKGRTPVRRGTLEFAVTPEDFDNPVSGASVSRSTSGSTGRGVQVTLSLDHIAAFAPYQTLYEEWLGVLHAPHAIWFQGFPGFLGPQNILRCCMIDAPVAAWFIPVAANTAPGLGQRLLRRAFLWSLRAKGRKVPDPLPMPVTAARDVARAMHCLLQAHGRCALRSYLSLCVRVCAAATDMGLDLTGCVLLAGGEPLTPAKYRIVTASGARIMPNYASAETGVIGFSCLAPEAPDDYHLMADAFALISDRRLVPGWDLPVDAFCLTSLLPTAPKILLNVESDDYGAVADGSCGCPWESLGFTTHIRSIRSYGKLTGEGITLVESDALDLLETALPEHFGGTALDYQLREEEDEQGLTKVSLVVSPRVRIDNPDLMVEFFLDALRGDRIANPGTASAWRAAGTVRVVREEPGVTGHGKIMPLRLVRRQNLATPMERR